MKVYVDENDIGRKIVTYHDGTNTQQGLYVYGKDKIIIQSLSDYTKQVRKEVVQEIKNKIEQAKMIYEWKGKEITIEEILDQIQGENNI